MTLDWQSAYDQKLKGLPPTATWKDVMDCVWEHGILGHLSPEDPEVFRKREEKKRPVWRRDDPVLYWRILYAAHGAAGTYRERWSFRDSIVMWPVALMGMARKNLDAEWRDTDGMLKGIDAVAARAGAKIRELGETPHRIPWGAKGTYQADGTGEKFHVVVERYDSYGGIALNVDREHYGEDGNESYNAWCRLGVVALLGLAEHRDLNPANFVTKFGEPIQS